MFIEYRSIYLYNQDRFLWQSRLILHWLLRVTILLEHALVFSSNLNSEKIISISDNSLTNCCSLSIGSSSMSVLVDVGGGDGEVGCVRFEIALTLSDGSVDLSSSLKC